MKTRRLISWDKDNLIGEATNVYESKALLPIGRQMNNHYLRSRASTRVVVAWEGKCYNRTHMRQNLEDAHTTTQETNKTRWHKNCVRYYDTHLLICQSIVLPSRGILTLLEWRQGLTGANPKEFNKGKSKAIHLCRNNPRHQISWGPPVWKVVVQKTILGSWLTQSWL